MADATGSSCVGLRPERNLGGSRHRMFLFGPPAGVGANQDCPLRFRPAADTSLPVASATGKETHKTPQARRATHRRTASACVALRAFNILRASSGGVSHRTKLFPNMFRFILHFMSGQHFQELFLEAAFFVVFYLAINVTRNEICLGATDCESTIAILPVEVLQCAM